MKNQMDMGFIQTLTWLPLLIINSEDNLKYDGKGHFILLSITQI